MRYVPKPIVPGTAILLKDDLVVEAGNWLLIGDNDTITILTDAQFRAIANIGGAPPKKPTQIKRGRMSKVGVGAGAVRVGVAMMRAGATTKPVRSKDVIAYMRMIADQKNVSARIADLVAANFAEKRSEVDGQHHYILTELGGRYLRENSAQAHEIVNLPDPISG